MKPFKTSGTERRTIPVSNYVNELRQLDFARRTLLITYFTLCYYLVYGAAKVIVGLCSHSLFLCISGVNTLLVGMAKGMCVLGIQKRRHMVGCSRCAGALLIVSGLVYAVYLAGAVVSNRHDFSTTAVSVFTAIAAVCELILAIHGVLIARTQHMLLFDIKVVSLSSALNALVLAQASLLSIVVKQDLSVFNGMISTGVGLITMFLGGLMLVRTEQIVKKADAEPLPQHFTVPDIKIFRKKE